MDCEFCEIEKIEKELVIGKTDKSIAFMCIEPLREGHLLVIPKRHVKELEELTKNELYDLIQLVIKVDKMLQKTYNVTSSFTYMKQGTAKSKEHLHMHVIPGFVPIREALAKYGYSAKSHDRKTIEELSKIADKIKQSGSY
jgi:diadenosine tetraphosphate (Ap4A) HIT family hydrolase